MAKRYTYQKSAQALYWPAHWPPFFEEWDAADFGQSDQLCAELCRLAYADKPTASAALAAVGFRLHHWLGGETAERRGATQGTDGFIASSTNGRRVILAFRGTESNKPEDVLTDALATSIPWNPEDPDGAQVHRGFVEAYRLVRDDIHAHLPASADELLITGHSLGAGLATLAAADFASRGPALITFGSPLVGNEEFRRHLSGVTIQRFVDCCDVVTRIPPRRFEQEDIATLLRELIPTSRLSQDPRAATAVLGLVKAVSVGLATALAVLGVQPKYEHVSEPIYRNRNGLRIGVGDATPSRHDIERDQQEARKNYQGSLTPDPDHLLHGLLGAVSAAILARDAAAVRTAIRTFGVKLFQGDPVPLRDLADHAPLNYVTLFTGRRP